MSSGQLAAAIEWFKLNAEPYPRSANVYGSLAEAFMNAGERQKAIGYYERSLKLNPGNRNAVTKLKGLRGR